MPAQAKDVDGNKDPALKDEVLVVPFANLLERLGCAVDLAVIDELNQPLPQRRLIEWLAGQPWTAVRNSIGAGRHEVVLVVGREPDTELDNPGTAGLDEDQSLGYAFAKLIVVPRSVLGDMLGRSGQDGTMQFSTTWLTRALFTTEPDDLAVVQTMAKRSGRQPAPSGPPRRSWA